MVLAMKLHAQVRPPCNYVANAVSLWYHPCKFFAAGVNFDEHGV